MFGRSGKLGRGGRGGGAGKRNINATFHPPPLNRASAAPSGRLSMPGAGPGRGLRGRTTTNSPAGAATSPSSSGTGPEETFSLVTGNPLNFAMIIRLAPDLVEEIKRVEEQGGSARIKFDANANNPTENVINVGGKDFRFTWSREPGDLCDIYEERKSGEDGNGMLVESGCAWRKLNVQRVLDESTKNHVKMRSEEAERKNKSRKAIVLDPGNPSNKSQMKAFAAAETNPWRMPLKQKKEPPFKKQKLAPPPGGPLKSMYKSNLSTTIPSKGRHSTSPQLPPPQQSGPPASPFGSVDPKKGRASIENVLGTQAMDKNISSEKEMPRKLFSSAGRDKPGRKGEVAKPVDLQSMLISLLKQNPLGMSLKALEKAIGDTVPSSVKQIEPIIKKIATYQAPGKYILKPGAEMEGFKKHSPEDGSSPSDNQHRSPAHAKYDQPPAPELSYPVRADSNALEDLENLENLDIKHGKATDDFEKIDIEHHSPDLFGEKKMSDSEGPKGSDSESGSDSDSGSDSSDSGSDRSKSRSPGCSRSGTSSDSDSDASSNSNAASDEDVDIMTSDGEKELKQKVQASEPGQLKSPFAWKTADGKAGSIETADKQGDLVVDIIEIEKDLLHDDNVGQIAGATNSNSNKGQVPEQETKPPSPEWNDHRERQVNAGWSHSERGNMAREDPSYEQSDNSERKVSKSKSKRGFNEKECDSKHDRAKRLKDANFDQPVVIGTRNLPSVESPRDPSPDRLHIHVAGTAKEDTADFVLQKGYSQGTYPKSSFETQQLSRRSRDPGPQSKAPAAVDRPGKHVHSAGSGAKHSERSISYSEGFPLQREKINREQQDDDTFSKNKRSAKHSEEGVEDEQSTLVDSHYRKHNKLRKFNETGSVSDMQTENSSKDTNIVYRTSVENGRSINLQREPSDLALGELREPLPEETHGKLFDRKSSSKHGENGLTSSEYWNSDSNKEKPAGRVSLVPGRTPPHNANIAVSGILESSKSRIPDHYSNNSTSYQHRTEQNQSRADRTDPGSRCNKLAEGISNNRESGAVMDLGTLSLLQQDDARREVDPRTLRENIKPQSSTSTDLNNRRKDTSLTESNDGGQKRRESSSDENSCSYSKYEKEKPALKGPIKDFSQYEEYVQEYNEKYEIYLSLNKNLESYRNEFSQLGRDLEASKGKDRERYDHLLAQLKESYRQCGAKHKRLKKIFIVIHAELKHLKEMITDFAASYTKS